MNTESLWDCLRTLGYCLTGSYCLAVFLPELERMPGGAATLGYSYPAMVTTFYGAVMWFLT